jgi:hypothetical protein
MPAVEHGVRHANTNDAYTWDVSDKSPFNAGAVLKSLSIDTTADYTIRMYASIGGNNINIANATCSVFCRMNDATPDASVEGLEIRIQQKQSLARCVVYDNGVEVADSFFQPLGDDPDVRTVRVVVHTGDTVDVFINDGGARGSITMFSGLAVNTHTGQRVGFGLNGADQLELNPNREGLKRYVAFFAVDYEGAPFAPTRNLVVAAGGSNASPTHAGEVDLRFEDTPGTLVAPVISGDEAGANSDPLIENPSGRQLVAAELLGRLYVVGEDLEEIWQFNPNGTGTLYSLGTSTDAEYPYVPSGTVPSGCTTIVAWRNRLCVVERSDPQNVSMSRVGVPGNWTFASLPVGAAVKLNTTGIDAGKLGEPINALIAHSDDYLLLGLSNSLFVLRGDPTLGGQVDRLSSVIGIVAPQAHARGPNGETVLLSTDGLYALPPGVLAYPESISREKLPDELRDIDQLNYRILMAYDVRNRGVFIGLTPTLSGGGTYFWFDWETRGFQRMFFSASHEPTALAYRNADSPLDQRLLFGCRDGFIRTFDNTEQNDDGTPFGTEALIGPIALGGNGYFDGMLVEVIGQLGIGSSDVTCQVQVGKSVEDAYEARPRTIGTLRAGKNLTFRPQLRGNACFIRLTTSASGSWAYENLSIVRQRLGKQRL